MESIKVIVFSIILALCTGACSSRAAIKKSETKPSKIQATSQESGKEEGKKATPIPIDPSNPDREQFYHDDQEEIDFPAEQDEQSQQY